MTHAADKELSGCSSHSSFEWYAEKELSSTEQRAKQAALDAFDCEGEHSESESDYLCPICQELVSDPIVGPCGHDFCQKCIRSWRDARKGQAVNCPVCRAPLPEHQGVCRRYSQILEKKFPKIVKRRREEVNCGSEVTSILSACSQEEAPDTLTTQESLSVSFPDTAATPRSATVETAVQAVCPVSLGSNTSCTVLGAGRWLITSTGLRPIVNGLADNSVGLQRQGNATTLVDASQRDPAPSSAQVPASTQGVVLHGTQTDSPTAVQRRERYNVVSPAPFSQVRFTWQTPSLDRELRLHIAMHVTEVLYSSRNELGQQILQQLPLYVRRIEAGLYVSSSSKDEYMDLSSLKSRAFRLLYAFAE